MVADSTYFVRAFIADSSITVYSKNVEFKTLANKAPVVETIESEVVMNGLTGATVYYVRAYVTNEHGTAYSDSVAFHSGYAVGSSFEGGKVAYVFQPGDGLYVAGECHGIEVTNSDYMDQKIWGEMYFVPAAQSTAVGEGWNNTQAIVASNSGQFAANFCVNMNTGGHTDWFLPTLDEMKLFDKNKDAIGGFNSGDYMENMYWTSSDKDRQQAYSYTFERSLGMSAHKSVELWFRAARYF